MKHYHWNNVWRRWWRPCLSLKREIKEVIIPLCPVTLLLAIVPVEGLNTKRFSCWWRKNLEKQTQHRKSQINHKYQANKLKFKWSCKEDLQWRKVQESPGGQLGLTQKEGWTNKKKEKQEVGRWVMKRIKKKKLQLKS